MKKLMIILSIVVIAARLVAAEEMALPKGFSVVESTNPYVEVKISSIPYPVALLDFEPKAVLKVKWGMGKDQVAQEDYTDNEASLQMTTPAYAVNSKGEIYILDAFNNRIQKYDGQGKYIKSIPVYGRTDRNGKSVVRKATETVASGENQFVMDGITYYVDHKKEYYHGLDMALDTMDNLFYLTQKGKTWEVWKFKDDVLTEKYMWKFEDNVSVDRMIGERGLKAGTKYIDDRLRVSQENGKVYMLISEWGSEWMKNYYPETGELAENADHVGDEIQRDGYRIIAVESKRIIIEINNGNQIIVAIPDNLSISFEHDRVNPFLCFFREDEGIRIYSTKYGMPNFDVIEYDCDGKLNGLFLNPVTIAEGKYDDVDYYRKRYDKFGSGYGGGGANNGEYYMGFYTMENLTIVKNELCAIKK